MQRIYLLPAFLICFILVVCIVILAKFGALQFVENGLQSTFFPLGQLVYQHTNASSNNSQLAKLQKENAALLSQMQSFNTLQADNKALRDQFENSNPPSQNLLPVKVVGMPGVIPNVSFPETLIIHAGSSEGIVKNAAVIVKNELIGFITQTSAHFSIVTLVSNPASSFSVKTSGTQAIGILKGQGNGQTLLDNVLLSDTLKSGDIVVTIGSQNVSGNGWPPDLTVGKIVSIEKNPSNLFQKANVAPLIAFDRLTTVFVVMK